jgi:membrane-bound metal-dependent hydrolase YbcI (DUF457 family)
MRGPTHAVIGLGVATPFAAVEIPHSVIAGGALLVAGVMAGTAPDVDLRLGLRHRGITHSVWAAAVAGVLVLTVGEAFESNYGTPAWPERSHCSPWSWLWRGSVTSWPT